MTINFTKEDEVKVCFDIHNKDSVLWNYITEGLGYHVLTDSDGYIVAYGDSCNYKELFFFHALYRIYEFFGDEIFDAVVWARQKEGLPIWTDDTGRLDYGRMMGELGL